MGDAGGRPDGEGRDLRQPHHLPNLREDGQPPHPSWLPRQRRGVTPQMVGRYPDYDVFDSRDTWDAATAKVIDERMKAGDAPFAFFTEADVPTLTAFCDLVTAQDGEPRIPVAKMVDAKLAAGELDGYQYADMPDDRETWHRLLAGLDEEARRRCGAASFAAAPAEDQQAVVSKLAKGELEGPPWEGLNVARTWKVCMRHVLSAFYSHPWSWNEIGFGGPAYPRGFMRMGAVSILEPFEKRGATAEDPVRAAQDMQG